MKLFVFVLFFVANIVSQSYAQMITTVAGGGDSTGVDGFGDGELGTSATIGYLSGIAADKKGNLYICDGNYNRVRKLDAVTGIITTIAGTGVSGYSGDGGLAINAELNNPTWLAIDAINNIYIVDGGDSNTHCIIRKIDTTGIITTIAGNGVTGFSGDGGPAVYASFAGLQGICFDTYNNIYVCDGSNLRIRKIDTAGIVTTFAGNGVAGDGGDNGPAIAASFVGILGICTNIYNNVYVADYTDNRIRKIDAVTGIITTVAGNGDYFFVADSVPATSAAVNPFGVATNKKGELFIADYINGRIRKVDSDGIISTVAGNGTQGLSGDGNLATSAEINRPENVTFDICNNMYIADFANRRIRKVTFNPNCTDTTGTDTTTSVSNISRTPTVRIYPNPAYSNVTVSSNSIITSITIINLLGQTVHKEQCNSNKEQINIANLPSGIYFIKVNDSYVQKMVKE